MSDDDDKDDDCGCIGESHFYGMEPVDFVRALSAWLPRPGEEEASYAGLDRERIEASVEAGANVLAAAKRWRNVRLHYFALCNDPARPLTGDAFVAIGDAERALMAAVERTEFKP